MQLFSNAGQSLSHYRYSDPDGSVLALYNIHPHWELYICADPHEQITFVNGTITTYTCPLAILISPYSQHGTNVHAKTLFIRDVFFFGEKFLAALPPPLFSLESYAESTACFFPLTETVAADLFAQCERMQNADKIERMLAFALLFRRLEAAVPERERCYIGKQNGYIQDVMRYIVGNLDRPLSIPELAARFNVSRNKLSADFRRFTGTTVHQFIVNLRLARACELLHAEPNPSIREVAHRCGFENEYYFTAFFKEKKDMTPREYARQR